MSKRLGAQTVVLPSRPGILAWASTAGQKEKEGPYGEKFDSIIPDELNGQQSFEGAERAMLEETIVRCAQKANKAICDVQMLLCGDLLNQIISAGFAARNLGIPFYGLYGACSTMAESLSVGGMIADGGFADTMVCATCSHFCTAERQYRAPLELGNQRTPTAQWTVTGAGAVMLAGGEQAKHAGAVLTHATCGRVIDLGISDANNMGAAMAPAGCDTLVNHFRDMNRGFDDYDLVVTGDLGHLGRDLLIELLKEKSPFERTSSLTAAVIFSMRGRMRIRAAADAAVRRACFAHICFRRWRRADWSVFCSWRRVRCSARRPRCRARAFPAWRTRL